MYYSPKTGYRSAEGLYKMAKEEEPSITKHFVKNWLLKQSTYTKFKKYTGPKHFRKTFVRDFDQLQMDLVFMTKYKDENDGFAYILVAVEILSRFAFVVGLKEKSGDSTREGIKIVIKKFEERFDRKPKKVQFDEGGEFLNIKTKKWFEEENIEFFTTASPRKASVVESLNKTLKTKLWKMLNAKGNNIWIDYLQDIVDNYNDSFHRSIGMKPKDVNEENKAIVWNRLFGDLIKVKKPKFQIGDFVRVLHFDLQYRSSQVGPKFKDKFKKRNEKGKYKQHPHAATEKGKSPFSEEIFMISEVLLGDPVVYRLYSDEVEDVVLGVFYEEELSLIKE